MFFKWLKSGAGAGVTKLTNFLLESFTFTLGTITPKMHQTVQPEAYVTELRHGDLAYNAGSYAEAAAIYLKFSNKLDNS